MQKINIDPHVHCRDGKQAYKETIKHVLEIAKEQGVEKIFDMPNTDPPILREKDVLERLKLVPEEQKGNYFLYIGATSDENQLKEAVTCYEKYKEVIGIKLYAGKSVGDLAVIEIESQKRVYRALAALEYKGVIAVHCEKEEFLKNNVWDASNPITHSYARPKEAEIESVKDQIEIAKKEGFEGILHICHVSCPESVELIREARKEMKITCGVTPHHIMWDNRIMKGAEGLIYKMNPPLREENDVVELRKRMKEGKIDWIETDHAPHAVNEKLSPPYMSGYPSLNIYREFTENFLVNMGMNSEQIKKMTQDNIYGIFSNKLE